MDAGKTQFPHERVKNKDLDSTERLKTHAVGIMCHGFPIPALALVHNLTHYSDDANLIVSALHLTLQRNIEKMNEIQKQKDKADEKMNNMNEGEREKYMKERNLREKFSVW